LRRDEKIQGITITASNFNVISCGKGSILSAFERMSQTSSRGLGNSSLATNPPQHISLETDWQHLPQSEEETDNEGANDLPNKPDADDTIAVAQTQSNEVEMKVTSKSNVNTFAKKRRHGTMPIENWFQPKRQSKPTSAIRSNITAKDNSKNHNFSGGLSYEDIDQGVLAELPFHIQAMVRKEMRQLKPKRL
jgi:hypothetical protein